MQKVRSTGPSGSMINTLGSTPSLTYTFHKLIPLPHLPNPPAALEILQKLSDDLAIKHVMAQHKFSVGILTELAPHEHPQLLGLNVNAGETIKLRIRTNAYDGFRSYNEIRRVLCHELAHNVWGDHDENVCSFTVTTYIACSQLTSDLSAVQDAGLETESRGGRI